MRPICIAVHGATDDSRKRWEDSDLPLELRFFTSDKTSFQVINELIQNEELEYALFCDSEVWIGPDIEASTLSLISELGGQYSEWGICSGVGVRWDGGRIYNFIRRPPANPEDAVSPKAVIGIGRGLILLNLAPLRRRKVLLKDLGSNIGFDIALSIEVLAAGLPILADRRLFVSHFPKEEWNIELISKNKALVAFLGDRLINHTLFTAYGPLLTMECQDLSYLALPPKESRKRDIMDLFDRSLTENRKHLPSLKVIVRTTLERRYLLDRAIGSYAALFLKTGNLISVELTLVSEADQTDLDAAINAYCSRYPHIKLNGISFKRREGRFSRVDAMLYAIEECQSDYIWFLDDDDFLFPDGAMAIGRSTFSKYPIIVTGACRTYEERWIGEKLLEFHLTSQIPSDGIFRAFSGENHTPFCGMVLPVKPLQSALANVSARGDYLEDYFILLKLLSSERVEVEDLNIDFAGISHRGSENTVRDTNRTHWNFSYAAFFQELLFKDESGRPLLWQMARK